MAAVRLGVAAGMAVALCAGVAPAARAAPKGPCADERMVAITGACCPPVIQEEPPLPAGCPDVATCSKACAAGDAIACLRAGDMLARAPLGNGRADAQAFILFDKGCRLGDCRACWRSTRGFRGDYAGLPDLEAALARDEADCKAGDPNSCRKLATIHREDGRYAAFEQRACDLGSAPACVELSDAYGHPYTANAPLGLDMTPGVPGKLIERACKLGHVVSCVGLVTWGGGPWPIAGLSGQRLVAAQWKLASDMLDPFCRRGEVAACRALGRLRVELDEKALAKPAGWDAMLGVRYLDHACTMRDGDGCYELGVARLHAAHFKGDLRGAKAALERSCSFNVGRGCVALSQLTPDRRRAQALIDAGCQQGARGHRGNIYANAGLSELPQPLNCSPRRR